MVTGIEMHNAHTKQVVMMLKPRLSDVMWYPDFRHMYRNTGHNASQDIINKAEESDIGVGIELKLRIVRAMGRHIVKATRTAVPRPLALDSYVSYASSTSGSNFRYHLVESFERATLVETSQGHQSRYYNCPDLEQCLIVATRRLLCFCHR